MTGFPQQTAYIILGLVLFGQAMGADENGSVWDCHTNPAGTVECVGKPTKPADLVEPELQPTPVEPESTAAPPADTQAAEPAPDVATEIPAPAARLEPDQSISYPAANPWRLCADTATRPSPLNFASIEEARRNATIDVEADSVELQENQIYTLTGNVAFQRADQHLEAQHLVYDKQQGSVTAEGSIHYLESGLSVKSGRMQLDMNSDYAELEDVEYYVPAGHARGNAKQVTLEGPGVQHLTKATYTTCDATQEDWRLSARQVTLLQDKGVGRAKGVTMRFKKIPIFYTPYLSFPLNERRKSGFLAPTIGGSEESGADVRLPFYWNIAPHRDALITPRWLEKRGTQLGAELRYLNRNNSGKASVEYLPSDNEFGKDRSLIALEHRGRLTPHINTVLLFKEVSDREYFGDLGDSLNIASTTHLERRAEATYWGNNMKLSARVQDFQTVDPAISDADKPYQRLPQIRFVAASPWQPLGFRSGLKAEYTYFDHEVKLSGHRLDLQPRMSLPLQKAAYSITPQVAVRYTRYELNDPLTSGASKSPDRTTPIYSVDSRMFLERKAGFRSNRFLHTLEPRVYYLYVPKRNQEKLPVFDTGELDFQFNQMFVENRFNGPDRMGDANQITLALTTRMLDPVTGKQHLRASIGEIFYFRDLEVALPGESVVKDNRSDIIGELQLQLLHQWKLSSGLQWNPNDARMERGQMQVQYSPDPRHILNLSYRYRKDILDQVDASLLWQLTPSWSAVGRWNYSFDDKITLESFAGLEYDSCCWAVRFVAREYINRNNGDSNRSLYLQMEFKGLGAVGKPVEDLLERGILGYHQNP